MVCITMPLSYLRDAQRPVTLNTSDFVGVAELFQFRD